MKNLTKKINHLCAERKWSVYKLSQESELPAPTIHKWFRTNMFPSIPALIQVCKAFGITLADFFAEGELVELTPEMKELYDDWCLLSKNEREVVQAVIRSYKDRR